MIITSRGTLIRLPVKGVSVLGRATQGVHLVRVGEEDRVAAVAQIASEEQADTVATDAAVEASADAPSNGAGGRGSRESASPQGEEGGDDAEPES